ncbi:hypothetical protein M9Y10_013229 [Tritrichomonas musculus]|uniref:EGF-like domain-containing protein n=1 Tax=Tritrichomonas musculus TaxID=1915356 RepID=A0ABR2I7N1_9EUKA
MFIFFFNLATFILKQNHNQDLLSKNQANRIVKATTIEGVKIEGIMQAGQKVKAILTPDSANDATEEEYNWEKICETKECIIPANAAIGSIIRVTVTGSGEFSGTVTSQFEVESGSEEPSSALPEEPSSALPEEPSSALPEEPSSALPEEPSSTGPVIDPNLCKKDNTNCDVCKSDDPSQCEKCKVGYEFNSQKICVSPETLKTCIDKVPNCASCDAVTATVCAGCIAGYKLNGGSCEQLSCASHISHCQECNESGGTFCTKCEEGYGKASRESSQCTVKCDESTTFKDGIFCKPKCHENCTTCDLDANGNAICYACAEGYVQGEGQAECRLKTCMDLEVDEKVGCLECNESDIMKCGKCDESLNFVLVDGKCQCPTEPEHHLHENMCKTAQQYSCLTVGGGTIENCHLCADETHCATCSDTYELEDGKCVSIKCDQIKDCNKCTKLNGNLQCISCDGGNKPNHDKTQCVKEAEEACTVDIVGCANCSNTNRIQCYVCDEASNFNKDPINGQCSCKPGYELVGSICLPPIEPVPPPPPVLPTKPVDFDSMFVEKNAGVETTNLTFNPDGYKFQNDVTYTLSVSAKNDIVMVPENANISSVSLKLGQRTSSDDPVQIIAPKVDNLNVEFGTDTSIAIPPSSKNIDLTGMGTITIVSTEQSNTIEIGKIVPSGSSDGESKGIVIESNATEIIIDEVQVFGQTTLKGLENGETKCSNLVLEGGSDISVEKVSLDRVFIGLLSTLTFDKPNVTVDNAEIKLLYNRTINQRHFPIRANRVKGVFPDFKKVKKVFMDTISSGDYIKTQEEEEEEFLVAHFTDEENNDKDAIYQSCLDLAGRYDYSNGFGSPQCVNSTDDGVYTDLLVKKTDPPKKDKGSKLSGGAIAGIVIACIVVVAAIIALLVYFLVIKKRNQSTTSTQGDSSIAI